MSTPPRTVSVTAVLGEFLAGVAHADQSDQVPVRHAAIVSAAVATVRAGLETRFRELQHAEADRFRTEPGWTSGDGAAVMCAIARFESILDALTDAATLMGGGRTSGVWSMLDQAGHRLQTLQTLTDADPEGGWSVVVRARSAEIALQTVLLDVLKIEHDAAPAATDWCADHTTMPTSTDSEVAVLAARITTAARAARTVLPPQVTDPTVNADHIEYTQVAACTTAQAHLVLDLLEHAAGAVCEYLDSVCLNPWWLPIADDVAAAIAAAHENL
ncbi:hypothetical protein [Rhodococcus koreensis]